MTADEAERQRAGTILVVDDDVVLGSTVQELLVDEGYAVSVLHVLSTDAIRTAVGLLEPDCILLDSPGRTDYGPRVRIRLGDTVPRRALPDVEVPGSSAPLRSWAVLD